MTNVYCLINILLILFCIHTTLNAGLSHIKEKKVDIYFESSLNPYTVEYTIKLIHNYNEKFEDVFSLTNHTLIKIYLYNNTVNFIKDQSSAWWQNYLIRTNYLAINNLDLLMEKNSLQNILKYLIYYVRLSDHYSSRLPSWTINGLAIYYSNKELFKYNNIRFISFEQVIEKLNKYTYREELEQLNYYCCLAVQYLIENYNDKMFFDYLKLLKDPADFEKLFFNYFGMTYEEYFSQVMNIHSLK